MITPVNGHLLIEPLKHESFMASDKGTYEEVGVVVRMPGIVDTISSVEEVPKVGDKVYFDSWLAGKFPKNDTEYFWLVNWKDVKAIEHGN